MNYSMFYFLSNVSSSLVLALSSKNSSHSLLLLPDLVQLVSQFINTVPLLIHITFIFAGCSVFGTLFPLLTSHFLSPLSNIKSSNTIFLSRFDPSSPCSFHVVCPCNKCIAIFRLMLNFLLNLWVSIELIDFPSEQNHSSCLLTNLVPQIYLSLTLSVNLIDIELYIVVKCSCVFHTLAVVFFTHKCGMHLRGFYCIACENYTAVFTVQVHQQQARQLVVTQLCTHYKLHHIEVIKESITKLVSTHHTHTRIHTHTYTHTHTILQSLFISIHMQEQTTARTDVDNDDKESDSKAQQANECLEVLKDIILKKTMVKLQKFIINIIRIEDCITVVCQVTTVQNTLLILSRINSSPCHVRTRGLFWMGFLKPTKRHSSFLFVSRQ